MMASVKTPSKRLWCSRLTNGFFSVLIKIEDHLDEQGMDKSIPKHRIMLTLTPPFFMLSREQDHLTIPQNMTLLNFIEVIV